MYSWAKALFPINRSITGSGVRETLEYFKKIVPSLKILSFPTGFEAFDWTVPQEWSLKEAYIEDKKGNRVIDFKNNNLHVVGYSKPVKKYLEYDELKNNLHFIKDQPNAIPYVTSYYNKEWGFCLTYNQFLKLKKEKYYVNIDSSFKDGILNYGEIVIKGKSEKEIFISSYICHPSMANNELSGPVLAMALARELLKQEKKYTYRIILIPETIGSLCYLKKNLKKLKKNVIAGYNITCVGDEKGFSYLPSRNGDTLADRAALNILKSNVADFKKYTWFDRGSDERQYCWPGIDLPVCSIMRSKYGEYAEYHTSLDNMRFISKSGLFESFAIYSDVLGVIERNDKFITTTLGEPKLDKRGLYSTLSKKGDSNYSRDILNFLSICDGNNDLIEISNILEIPVSQIMDLKNMLLSKKLIKQVSS